MTSTEFQTLESQFKAHVLSDPDASMALGDVQYLGELGDPSLAAMEAETKRSKELLAQLGSYQTTDFNESLDLQLMARYLKQSIFFNELQQSGQPQRCRKPSGIDGISAGIFQLFVNDDRLAEQRIDNILSRLSQAPDYLKQELNVITQPVKRWLDIELEQGEGLADLFATIYHWAKEESYSKLPELYQAIQTCNEAVSGYLSDLKSRDTITEFSIGEDKVNALLALREINKSPEQLVNMARDFMGETQTLLADLSVRLCEKYQLPSDTSQEQLHEFLNKQFSATLKNGKLDSILDIYNEQISSINQFIENNQLRFHSRKPLKF